MSSGSNGGKIAVRAGTRALSLLAAPLNVEILEVLGQAPRPLVDLRQITGSPPQTTMRGHLRTLTALGVLTKRRQEAFPGSVDYALTPRGHDLLTVAQVVREWLARAPNGTVVLGSLAAKSAIKALVDGWSTSMLRALASRPLSLTELDRIIVALSYPALERRLLALRMTGQIAPQPGRGRATPYAVTGWLRQAMAPLTAAARWEGLHIRDATSPISHRDAEAAFLLSLPLLRLSEGLSGSCRLAVEFADKNGWRPAGALVHFERGRIVSCTSRLEGDPDADLFAPAPAWLHAVVEHRPECLEIRGDQNLANAVLDGLHSALFRPQRKQTV